MSIIEEIQKEAVDSNSDLGSLLRKCKILAARLASKPLEEWLNWESNGYPQDIELPNYRTWPLSLKGNFSGPFGSGLSNALIPLACLPEVVRSKYQKYECRQSIASIEQLLKSNKTGILQISTGDLALALGTKVYENMNCLQAWAEFGAGSLIEILNSVRNRILDFSIAIWKENPDVGNTSTGTGKDLEPAKVTQIFNTTVYGGSANLIGTANDSQITIEISANDIESLEKLLLQNKVLEKDIAELKMALQEEKRPANSGQFGPKVTAWISKMFTKACDGSWAISIGAAGKLLADAISRYYGLQ